MPCCRHRVSSERNAAEPYRDDLSAPLTIAVSCHALAAEPG